MTETAKRSTRARRLGRALKVASVVNEFDDLARADEDAARRLFEHGCFRQAVYFTYQSMEKLVRGRIFARISPDEQAFQRLNATHNLVDSLEILVSVYCTTESHRPHVLRTLLEGVLQDVEIRHLNNDLRYPFYDKNRGHMVRRYEAEDVNRILGCLQGMKTFLKDLHRLG